MKLFSAAKNVGNLGFLRFKNKHLNDLVQN